MTQTPHPASLGPTPSTVSGPSINYGPTWAWLAAEARALAAEVARERVAR